MPFKEDSFNKIHEKNYSDPFKDDAKYDKPNACCGASKKKDLYRREVAKVVSAVRGTEFI